jgi:hypothetical protein
MKIFKRIVVIFTGCLFFSVIIWGPGPILLQYIKNYTYVKKIPTLRQEWLSQNIHNYTMKVQYFAGPMCIETYNIIVMNDEIIDKEIISTMWDKKTTWESCYKDDVTIIGMFSFVEEIINQTSPNNTYLDITIDNKYGYISKMYWGCQMGLLGSAIGDCRYSYRFEDLYIIE